jgi:amidohydrolase
MLQSLGFEVTPRAYGVETSFSTEYGSGGRVVTFNAEYDALPGIGHACGHNLIATSSLAGFLGVAAALKASGVPGRVRLLGTPAEEGGCGKQVLIDAGAFKDVNACFMSHPGPKQMNFDPTITGTAYGTSLASAKFTVAFTGKPAHAALAPYQGVNALDAMTLAYSAVSMLRQQTKEHDRIHFVIDQGGEASNVIPTRTSSTNQVRSATMKELRELRDRVKKCFEGSAIATGCTVEFEEYILTLLSLSALSV